MLRERPSLSFCEGEPRRSDTMMKFTGETAWRVENTFILTLPPTSPGTVDPPALVIEYEGVDTIHVHAQLALGTWRDQLAQHGGELVRQGALRTGLFSVAFAISFVTLIGALFAALLLTGAATLFGELAAMIVAWFSFVFAVSLSLYVFVRTAFSPILDHAELAWANALPRLTEMSGQLLTPHVLGSADAVQALPYRSSESDDSAA